MAHPTDDGAVHAWLAGQGAQRDFIAWAEPFGGGVEALVRACPRGDWLLALAARLGAEPAALVRAACGCAEQALEHVPPEQPAVGEQLALLRTWAEGGDALSSEQVERMRAALEAARDAAQAPAEAEAALAVLAALETLGDPAFAASAAAFAAHAAMVSAADCAMLEAARFAQHQCAEAVRTALPPAAFAALWARRRGG